VTGLERATRSDLAKLPESVRDSALAQVALDLARRLDGDVADTAAVLLARELRMCLADLHHQGKEDTHGDIDDLLERIATPAFRDAPHGA